MLNLNQAPEQRQDGLIPDGTFCKLVTHIKPGGYTLPNMDPCDDRLFTASKTSDAIMVNFEFTVLAGPYAKRKIWQSFTIAGGQVDEKGVSKAWPISLGNVRAMIESAYGIDPKDQSQQAQDRREIDGFAALEGLEFVAKIGVELGGLVNPNDPNSGKYPDKNRIVRFVPPTDPEWEPVMNGREVPPKPSGPATPRGSAPAHQQQGKAAWQTAATPAKPSAPMAWSQGGTGPAIELDLTPKTSAQANSGTQTGPAWLRGK